MFCIKCGFQLDETTKFCPRCGLPNVEYPDPSMNAEPKLLVPNGERSQSHHSSSQGQGSKIRYSKSFSMQNPGMINTNSVQPMSAPRENDRSQPVEWNDCSKNRKRKRNLWIIAVAAGLSLIIGILAVVLFYAEKNPKRKHAYPHSAASSIELKEYPVEETTFSQYTAPPQIIGNDPPEQSAAVLPDTEYSFLDGDWYSYFGGQMTDYSIVGASVIHMVLTSEANVEIEYYITNSDIWVQYAGIWYVDSGDCGVLHLTLELNDVSSPVADTSEGYFQYIITFEAFYSDGILYASPYPNDMGIFQDALTFEKDLTLDAWISRTMSQRY